MEKRDDRSVARVTCRSGNRALTSSANSLTTNVDISKFMEKKAFCGRGGAPGPAGGLTVPPLYTQLWWKVWALAKYVIRALARKKKVKINEKRFFYTKSKKHAVFFMTN